MAPKVGILVKGSNYLEALAHLETVVFDKTGTLTEGTFEVQKVVNVKKGLTQIHKNVQKETSLINIAAHAEMFSNHPISLSLRKAYSSEYGKDLDSSLVSKTEEIPGLGIFSEVNGQNVFVGNEKLMEKNNIAFSKCDEVGTVLHVAIDGVYAGYIVIGDKIKSDAKQTITDLKSYGVKQTVMLTGDRKVVGESVANNLGIDIVYTDLLPQDKAKKLEEIMKAKSSNSTVAFVGDGMNDAPVLAISDVGIAMGGLGADSAIEAADVVIMNDEPSKIITSVKIARKTLRIVKQNIVFAIFVKVLVLIFSAFGLSTMWEAVFADVGVSVLAVLNALRALKSKI